MNSFAHTMTAPQPLLSGTNRYLLVAVAVLLVYYVVQANMLAADTWRLRSAQDELSTVRTSHDTLVAEQAHLEDRAALQALAADAGMVPAGTVSYLTQSSDVATVR